MATQQNKSANNTETRNASQANRLSSQELEAQDRYWRGQFKDEPYYAQGKSFEAYEPAYRLGIEARSEHQGKKFGEVEQALRSRYESNTPSQDRLDWSEARQAVQAAWDRSDQQRMSGDMQGRETQAQGRQDSNSSGARH